MKIEIGNEYKVCKRNDYEPSAGVSPYTWYKIKVTKIACDDWGDDWINFNRENLQTGIIFDDMLPSDKFKSYIIDDPYKSDVGNFNNVDNNVDNRLKSLEEKFAQEIKSIDHVLDKMSVDLYKHEFFQGNLMKALNDFLALIKTYNKSFVKDSINE